MRTWTTAEERSYDVAPIIRVKVEISDSTDVLREWTNIDGRGLSLIQSISWGDSLDQPMASGEASITWKASDWDNASPFMSGGRLEGYLAAWRRLVVSVKSFPPGADESTFPWREVLRARIDDFDLSQNPGKIQFRDAVGAELMDQFITSNTRLGDSAGTKDIEDVITDILAAFDKTSPQHTLNLPAPTTLQVRTYNQQKMPILQACENLSVAIGWDLRAKWVDASSSWKLTLYEPDRTGTVPDHTIPAEAIASFGSFSYSIQNVRNVVRVFYGDPTGTDDLGEPIRRSIVRTAVTSPINDLAGAAVANSSIAKYGWRYMELAEGSTSLVQGTSQAQALADFALSDLADPTLLMGVTLKYLFWPVELNDLYTFEADQIRFGTDSDLAIHSYRHTLDSSGQRTELSLQGKPGIGTTRWTNRETRPGKQAPADDLAPTTPSFTVSQTPLGATITVTLPTDYDLDQILFYESRQKVFTPSSRTLVQAGRQKVYTRTFRNSSDRAWVKIKALDIHGNYSAEAGPIALAPSRLDAGFFSPMLQAKMGLRFATDTVISVTGAVRFQRYSVGGSFGFYDLANGMMEVPETGVYRIAMSGTLSSSMTEGSDYAVALLRDPGGEAEEIARAVIQPSSGGADQVYMLEDFIALDAGDVFEVEVLDLGAAPFTTVTFRAATSHLLIEKTVGTEGRTNRTPIVQPEPAFVDHGLLNNFSAVGGACQGVALLTSGEVLFGEGAAGADYPASIVASSERTTRSVSISGSTNYFFTRAASGFIDGIPYFAVGAHKQDATIAVGLRLYQEDGTLVWTSTDFGTGVVVRGVAFAFWGSFAATDEGAAGKLRRVAGGIIDAQSGDLGGPCWGAAVISSETTSRVLTVCITTSTIHAFDAFPTPVGTWTSAWTLNLSTLVTHPGTAAAGADVIAGPSGDQAYVSCGPSSPFLYAIAPDGSVLWSVDCGTDSTLADVTGVICIATHPATGDLYALVRYTDVDAVDHLDLLVYDPTGVFRWSFRDLDDLDPADDPGWTTGTTHFMTVDAQGAVWISNTAASSYKKFKPYATTPSQPPVLDRAAQRSLVLADVNPERLPYASGAQVPTVVTKQTSIDLRLQQSTAAEQPTYIADGEAGTLGAVERTLTDHPALTFDGTDDINSSSDAVNLAGGFAFVMVAEPVDATRNYFSLYPDAGSAAAPAAELYVDADGNLRLAANEDIAGETYVRRPALGGAQVIGGRLGTTAALWFSNAKPNRTEAREGTNPTPDTAGRFRLGRSSGTSGVSWFRGWTYRLILLDDDAESVSRVTALVHWARAYYGIAEVVQPAADVDPPLGTSGYTKVWTKLDTDVDYIVNARPTQMESHGANGCVIGTDRSFSSLATNQIACFNPEDGSVNWRTTFTTDGKAWGISPPGPNGELAVSGYLYGSSQDKSQLYNIADGTVGASPPGIAGGLVGLCYDTFVTQDGLKCWVAAASQNLVGRWDIAAQTWDFQTSCGSIQQGTIGGELTDGRMPFATPSASPARFKVCDTSGTISVDVPIQTGDASTTFTLVTAGSAAKSVWLDRDNNHFYMVVTRYTGSLAGGAYVLRVDADTGANGTVVATLADSGSASAFPSTVKITRDRDGGWWLLLKISSAFDILRYTSDWTLIHTLKVDFSGSEMFVDHTSAANHLPHDMCINEDMLILSSRSSSSTAARISGYRIV